MKKRYFAYGLAGLVAVGAIGLFAADRIPASPGPAGEAPELARAGEFAIGTTVKSYALPGRLRITKLSAVTGNLPVENRALKVRLWYPATPAANARPVRYTHSLKAPGQPAPVEIMMSGIAVEGATPLKGQRFPLVLMSHGFGAWDTHYSNLGESLAAHGYVVASINHADMPIEAKSDFLIAFGNVLVDRTQDQRQILAQLLGEAQALNIDAEKVGLLGYSMGGYGALSTAGAYYDPKSPSLSQLPEAAKKVAFAPSPDVAAKIDALVLLAPWGGQPDSRAWSQAALARVTAPTLILSGDHDDIVNFKEGVSWIFNNLAGSDRHMLVYREARHNIAGNAITMKDDAAFQALEFMTEPVWRQDRLNMINQHFIRAFLDLNLKGDASKAAYLKVPTPLAGDGEWPVGFGENVGGTMAGDAQPKHWRGFQRRWALGLEMQHMAKGAKR